MPHSVQRKSRHKGLAQALIDGPGYLGHFEVEVVCQAVEEMDGREFDLAYFVKGSLQALADTLSEKRSKPSWPIPTAEVTAQALELRRSHEACSGALVANALRNIVVELLERTVACGEYEAAGQAPGRACRYLKQVIELSGVLPTAAQLPPALRRAATTLN